MKKALSIFLRKFGKYIGFEALEYETSSIRKIIIEQYLEDKILNNPRYSDDRKLNKFEYQVLSQNGEDGIIAEIFKRIGFNTKYFVEFGVGDGIENNSAALLLDGWKGFWIEGSSASANRIHTEYGELIKEGLLTLKETYITAENIAELFTEAEVPKEPDMISIDIDGNDYWIWKALKGYRPRLFILEYNASIGPSIDWKMPYDPSHWWNGREVGNYFGAGLKSLEKLGNEFGYSLVGCNLTGANSFFVRNDLVNESLFMPPFTSENHYEKPLYFLEKQLGHKRNHKLVASVINQNENPY